MSLLFHSLIALGLAGAAPLQGEAASDRGPRVETPDQGHPLNTPAGNELNRTLRSGRPRDCDGRKVVADLSTLGTPLVPGALWALAERKLPAIDDAQEQVLSEQQERLLVDALETLEPEAAWRVIESSLSPPRGKPAPTLAARRAALLAAGACGKPEQLLGIASMALAKHETELAPELEEAWRACVERLYVRAPESLPALAGSWRFLRPELMPGLVAAAGSRGDARALPLLSEMLDQLGDLQSIALAQLALQRAPLELPMGLCERLRHLLESEDQMRCQSACNALSALGDFESAQALEALLDSETKGIRTTAHRALCRLRGLALPAQVSCWRAWRVRESEWFDRGETGLYRAILVGTEEEARKALGQMTLYRWQRHVLTDIAAEALRRPEPELRALACALLVDLGSPRARPALEAALEDAGEEEAALLRGTLGRCPSP